jgi:aubergine-like protein
LRKGYPLTGIINKTKLSVQFSINNLLFQVITGRIIEGNQGKLMSVATKVMTQIACKLGAEPWKAQVPNKVINII